MFTQSKPGLANAPAARTGWKVISVEDQRWARRDIKTVQLLFPSIAKMEAKARGVDDAWMVEDGKVTEGTSNNAYIVKNGTIVTRALSIKEAQGADEAFITSASAFVMPVVEIDGAAIGTGQVGPVATRLREIYLEESRKAAI